MISNTDPPKFVRESSDPNGALALVRCCCLVIMRGLETLFPLDRNGWFKARRTQQQFRRKGKALEPRHRARVLLEHPRCDEFLVSKKREDLGGSPPSTAREQIFLELPLGLEAASNQ